MTVNPVHEILNEAKRRVAADPTGPDWFLIALEKLSGTPLGASRKASSLSGNDRATLRLQGDIISRLISAFEKLGKMPQRPSLTLAEYIASKDRKTARQQAQPPAAAPIPPDPEPAPGLADF